MIKTMIYYLDVTFTYIKMAILSMIEYPANIVGWLISNPIQFILGFATIRFVVEQFGSIHGWNYGQLAFLYGIAVLSHALSMIFFVSGWFMGAIVLEGEFDRMLTRPMSVAYQFFFTNFNVIGITDMVPGLIVFLYGCKQVGFHWTLVSTVQILLLLIGATLIRGSIYMILGTTSFWTRSALDFGAFTQESLDRTTMYPLSMYPEKFQFVLTYLIPIGWIAFYPASSLLNMENGMACAPYSAFITFGIGILMMLLAAAVFNIGLRQYESAGN